MNLKFKENISQVKHIFGIFLEHSKAEQHTERKKTRGKRKSHSNESAFDWCNKFKHR